MVWANGLRFILPCPRSRFVWQVFLIPASLCALACGFLSIWATIVLIFVSVAFLAVVMAYDGLPPLYWFMIWLIPAMFCVGLLIINLNALAMEPVGHMAGIGAALVGSLLLILGLPFGWAIGYWFDGTLYPIIIGFALLGIVALVLAKWTDRAMT